MIKWITITLLLLTTCCCGQNFNGFYTDFGYQTNFSRQNLNINFVYEIKPKIDSMYKLIAIGAGAEWFFDKDFLFDTKISTALKQEWRCHWFWKERFATWFIAGHYKFSKQFNKQFICPEIGYNFRVSSDIFLTPSVNYYIDIKSKESWSKSIYVTFKIKYLLTSGWR